MEQNRYVQKHLDHLRTMLMAEPRGHVDMYGALLVEKTNPLADMAVLFLYNGGVLYLGIVTVSMMMYCANYGRLQYNVWTCNNLSWPLCC